MMEDVCGVCVCAVCGVAILETDFVMYVQALVIPFAILEVSL